MLILNRVVIWILILVDDGFSENTKRAKKEKLKINDFLRMQQSIETFAKFEYDSNWKKYWPLKNNLFSNNNVM
jgi:hypothetical protein